MYEYDEIDDTSVRITSHTAEGEADGWYAYTYDDEDRVATITTYDADDELQWRYEFAYDENGNRMGEEKYDAEGDLLRSSTFEFELIFG